MTALADVRLCFKATLYHGRWGCPDMTFTGFRPDMTAVGATYAFYRSPLSPSRCPFVGLILKARLGSI